MLRNEVDAGVKDCQMALDTMLLVLRDPKKVSCSRFDFGKNTPAPHFQKTVSLSDRRIAVIAVLGAPLFDGLHGSGNRHVPSAANFALLG